MQTIKSFNAMIAMAVIDALISMHLKPAAGSVRKNNGDAGISHVLILIFNVPNEGEINVDSQNSPYSNTSNILLQIKY